MSDEVIYVNTSQLNTTPQRLPISYNRQYDEPFLKHPNLYNLSIVTFRVPNTIPIQLWPGDDFYYITLSFNGTDTTVPLEFQVIDFTSQEKLIETFDQFCDIMNTAFQMAFVGAQGASATQLSAPYITFDADSDLFTIVVPETYTSDPIPIDIFFNTNLQLLFDNSLVFHKYGYFRPDRKDEQLILRDNRQNVFNNNYNLKQELTTINSFYSFQSLIFTTNLPINTEFLNIQNESKTSGLSIISSFYGDIGIDRSDFRYSAPHIDSRPITITADQPLRQLSFECYWVTKDHRIVPVYLNSGESMEIKFCFYRK